jgi:uncharacterized protein (TIGR04255 family)
MPVPDSQRVIYEKNPLFEVVCQIRFPAVLRIEAELPMAFQEAVRGTYPMYKEHPGFVLADARPEVEKFAKSIVPLGAKVYEFSSPDKIWKLVLSKEFLALTCYRYERWEDFRMHFHDPFSKLLQEYNPPFFSRIGLRYRNIIRRTEVNLAGTKWKDLLQPYIAGVLDSCIKEEVEGAAHTASFRLPDGRGSVTMNFGLAQAREPEELCYLIDNDFFTEERSDVESAIDKLNEFHTYSGRLFRWSIKDQLHRAMGPTDVHERINE